MTLPNLPLSNDPLDQLKQPQPPQQTHKSAASSYHRLKMLFDEVCELSADQQRQKLIELQATEAETEHVQKLLQIDITTGDISTLPQVLMPMSIAASAASLTNEAIPRPRFGKSVSHMLGSMSASELKSGDKLGAWRLAEKIGEGGMGAVYRAQRDDGQFSQVAAVKLLTGMPTVDSLAHLARERQTLASLSHPNIARLIDGGTTPRGRPYLVMDYIEGIEIDRYCREKKLTPQAIIRLFCAVCETVSYAHQRLTLHCDLKPSNVLVDAAGRPVLLDFGISQMLEAVREIGIETTEPHAIASFTPRYASPEQASGLPLTTATDVFSLGRMLAQLLDAAEAATQRKNTTKITGECRAIVARATAQDVNLRYQTAQDLNADLMRLLADEPLNAVVHTPFYVARKFFERRWGSMVIVSTFVLMAVALTIGALIQRDRAVLAERQARAELDRALLAEDQTRAERDRAQVAELRAIDGTREANLANAKAQDERDRAVRAEQTAQNETARALRAETNTLFEVNTTREVRDFLVGLFEDADPGVLGSRQMTALDLLERGRKRIDTTLEDQPALQSTMFVTMGKIYENIGHPQYAKQLYEQAIKLEREPNRGRPIELAKILSRLAVLEANNSNPVAGELMARESLAIRFEQVGTNSLETADAHNSLGMVLNSLGKRRESEQHLGAALAIREREVGLVSIEAASTLHNLGEHYRKFGDLARAEIYYRRAVDIKRSLFAEQHPRILNSLEGLGKTLSAANRLSEAEAIHANVYKIRLEVYGKNSDYLGTAANEWASVLQDMGRYGEAKRLYQEAIEIKKLSSGGAGNQGMSYAVSINNLASLMDEMGDYAGAEIHYRDSLLIRSKFLKLDDIVLARAHHNLGRLLLKQGKLDDAEFQLKTALQAREAKLNTRHQDIFDTRLSLAEVALGRGQIDVAGTYLAAAKAALETVSASRKTAYLRADALYKEATGDPGQALILWELRTVEIDKLRGEKHPATLLAKFDFAEALAKNGDIKRAQTLAASLKLPLNTALAAGAPQLQRLSKLADGESLMGTLPLVNH